MAMKESYEGTIPAPPHLLRNIIVSIIINAHKSFLLLAQKYNILETFRFLFLTCFFFFLRFIPSSFLDVVAVPPHASTKVKPPKYDTIASQNDTSIARSLSQLLSILNNIPVSSRKYELVRFLAEKIIDENHRDGIPALRQVNLAVLSAAFDRTLSHVEVEVVERQRESGDGESIGTGEYRMRRLLRAVRTVGSMVRGGGEVSRSGIPAEKLAAELLWLAQKMLACGLVQEAVWRFAAAAKLGWLALYADPRLQTSLVKLAAFLFKEAKDMGQDEIERSKIEQHMQVKLKMLLSWLPLLCRASNGTDSPVLSISEKAELERVLEEIIEGLEQEEQEQVLSLWLHHFTHCPSSVWPNLQACYARWCTASRKQLCFNEN